MKIGVIVGSDNNPLSGWFAIQVAKFASQVRVQPFIVTSAGDVNDPFTRFHPVGNQVLIDRETFHPQVLLDPRRPLRLDLRPKEEIKEIEDAVIEIIGASQPVQVVLPSPQQKKELIDELEAEKTELETEVEEYADDPGHPARANAVEDLAAVRAMVQALGRVHRGKTKSVQKIEVGPGLSESETVIFPIAAGGVGIPIAINAINAPGNDEGPVEIKRPRRNSVRKAQKKPADSKKAQPKRKVRRLATKKRAKVAKKTARKGAH